MSFIRRRQIKDEIEKAVEKMNTYYEEYCRLLRELHKLDLVDKMNSPEADLIRDQMDEPWNHLTEEEIQTSNAWSAQLYEEADRVRPIKRGILDSRIANASVVQI